METPLSMPDGDIGPVVIVSDALPERNGVGAYYKDLLDHLNELGYEATFLCPNVDKWQLLKFPLPGDATQTVYLPSLFRFWRVMRAVRPRAIVVGTPGPFGLLGTFWARHLGARLLVGFHTHFSSVTDLYRNRWLRAFSRFYFNIADSLQFRYGDQILANSDQMVDLARSLEGLSRNAGKHAGGVVISPTKLTDFTPIYCEQGGLNVVSQFDKDDVEAVGLVKFDFLGLRTLTIIDWALHLPARGSLFFGMEVTPRDGGFRLGTMRKFIGQGLRLVSGVNEGRIALDEVHISELRKQTQPIGLCRYPGALGHKIYRPAANLSHRVIPANARSA